MPPQLWHLHTLTRLTEESHRGEHPTSSRILKRAQIKLAVTFHALPSLTQPKGLTGTHVKLQQRLIPIDGHWPDE